MRPIRLLLENFGPYRTRAEVDFSRLGPVFLVWGKTGSGKTTLFDAMTYALYGKVTGSRGGLENQLWSHYAKPGEKPLVEFEFALSSERFKAVRVPPRRKIGRNGEEKDVLAEASLYRAEGDAWVVVADKKSEVDEAIRSRVGLSVDEFSKIVLLPQGEFQRFLEMSSTERSSILEKLFPVRLHEAVAAIAREKAKSAADEQRRLDAEIVRLNGEAMAGLAGGQDDERIRLETLLAQREAERDVARAASVAALVGLERGMEGERLKGQLEAALRRLSLLEARQAEIDAKRALHSAGTRAKAVIPVLEAQSTAEHAHAAELSALDARRETLAGLQARAGLVESWRGRAGQCADSLASMDHELGELSAAGEAWKKVQSCRLSCEAATKRASLAERELARFQAVEDAAILVAGSNELDAAEEAAVSVDFQASREAFEASKKTADLVEELEVRRLEEGKALRDLEATGVELAKAEGHLAELEDRETRNLAARIATRLLPGQACPVCGSREHPAPAGGFPFHAPVATGENAAQAVRAERDRRLSANAAARGALEAAQRSHGSAMAALAANGGSDGSLPSREVAKAARAAAESVATVAAARYRSLGDRRVAREKARKALDEARLSREAAQAALGEARRLESQGSSELEALLSHAGGEDPGLKISSLASRRKALESERQGLVASVESWSRGMEQALALVTESEARLPGLAAAVADRREAARLALLDNGWTDAASARAGALSRGVIEGLEGELAAFDRDIAEARTLAEGPRAALGDLPPMEIALLEEAKRAASIAEGEAQRLFEASKDALAAFDRVALSLRRALVERQECAERSGRLASLAALLCGDLTDRRLPFKSYVLGLYFREVAERASRRLDEMSEGRYGLVADEGASGGRGRIGLELLVRDSYTGRTRPAGTLSGGERFLTSLALSLGLADTIRNRAGGASLDAIFIDEGFGSLDEEALDRAVEALDRARGARMIGLVSHVPELRSRIASRIEVEKGKGGSRLTIV